MTGQTISHYRVLEKLGEGGMGVVYKAEDTKLRRQVALKFLAPHLAGGEEVRRRFLHEAQAAAALSHPNICVVYEVDEENNFLGLEYVEGETVAAKIKRRPLPLEEALDIAIQTAQGLEAAHEKRIVHRDVKCPNLMVTPGGQVKVMDFGLAQLRTHSQITRTGTRLGTPGYMSPEQFRGEAVDHRTDIWSLGVVLYEMLAGVVPFTGDNEAALMYSVLNKEPEPLSARRAGVPTGLDRLLSKALAKDRNQRYQHIADLLVDLKALRRLGVSLPVPARKLVGKKAVAAALLVAAATAGSLWNWRQRVRAGQEKAFQEAVALYNAGQSIPAYKLARQLAAELPADPRTLRLWEQVGVFYSLSTEPAGADVSIRELGKADHEWISVGKTPLAKVRVPLETNLHLRVKMAGYEVVERTGLPHFLPSNLKLAKAGSWPSGMVPVQGADGALMGRQVAVEDFWLDKYETTNRQFKSFVDAGGYREKRFWKQPFGENGKQLTWEQAMKRFVDTTGRPGPATWELGTHPEGQAEYPVGGVSWYEAAAFAEFAGKDLPTIFHWGRAAIDTLSREILNASNFAGKGPAPAGKYQGASPFGAYDVAGNVKEWCWNQRGDRRYIMGQAWNEPSYSLDQADGASPFERRETMGFRCAKYNRTPAAATLEPFERIVRDYSKERPVTDEVFRAYRSLYSYDRGTLDAKVESADESEPSWRVERVTFKGADAGDRTPVYLYIPRTSTPPYQTVIHFPGSYAVNLTQINNLSLLYVRHFIQSGRAVAFPIFYGTYERRVKALISGPHSGRDLTIRWSKELGRTIDYLETRRDFDSSRLVFHGFSLGAGTAVLPLLGVEERLKFAILLGGGFPGAERLSEVDPINFMPRARMPVLMINGRDDFLYPMETSQKPLFRFLGSPPEHKRHAVFESGHVVPRNAVIKESLDWLDRYLGPVAGK